MRSYIKFLWLLLPLFIWGCDSFTTDRISEGAIEFDITYPKADKNDLMASLMPETMKFRFKDDKITSELTAGMGMFSTIFISDGENKTLSQLVKIMNKKMAHTVDEKGVMKMKSAEPQYDVEFVSGEKEIAGYKCKKAIVVNKVDPADKFEVYYTDKIDIEKPNWSTPYDKIDGVLLQYEMSRYNIHMRFTAKTVSKEPVEDKEFEIPSDYKIVSEKEIAEVFENFQ